MSKYRELEERVTELEAKFELPFSSLSGTRFEAWVRGKAFDSALWGEFYLLLKHLGLEIVTKPEKKVVRKKPTSLSVRKKK